MGSRRVDKINAENAELFSFVKTRDLKSYKHDLGVKPFALFTPKLQLILRKVFAGKAFAFLPSRGQLCDCRFV